MHIGQMAGAEQCAARPDVCRETQEGHSPPQGRVQCIANGGAAKEWDESQKPRLEARQRGNTPLQGRKNSMRRVRAAAAMLPHGHGWWYTCACWWVGGVGRNERRKRDGMVTLSGWVVDPLDQVGLGRQTQPAGLRPTEPAPKQPYRLSSPSGLRPAGRTSPPLRCQGCTWPAGGVGTSPTSA
jgi:hypothetical protein